MEAAVFGNSRRPRGELWLGRDCFKPPDKAQFETLISDTGFERHFGVEGTARGPMGSSA